MMYKLTPAALVLSAWC